VEPSAPATASTSSRASRGPTAYDSLAAFYTTGGTKQLVAGAGNRLEAITTAGAVTASSTAPTANPHFFARFGGPTAELLFCANGTDQLRQWNGTAFSVPAWTGTAPTGKFLAVTPWDNRLVNARRGGTTAGDNPSSVRFSDPGIPTTWGANNYADLEPGDGEQITGMIAWRDRLFVFKETKFFVLGSTSVSSTGNPIFNYYPIENGQGLVSPGAICAGRDAVYFLGRDGVYRTTGGVGELISGQLDPFFTDIVPPDFYESSVLNHAQLSKARMTFWQEQIFLAIPTGSSTFNDRVLVHDPRFGWWTLYDLKASALEPFRIADRSELIFAYADGTKNLARHAENVADDDGTAISSRWRSGWFDLGATTIKTLREFKLWGKGECTFGVSRDFSSPDWAQPVDFAQGAATWGDGTSLDTWGDGTGTDTWSTGAAVAVVLIRRAVRGTVFSLRIESTDPWTLNRIAHHIREGHFASTTQRD